MPNAFLCLPVVIVMETTQHRARCKLPVVWRCIQSLWSTGNALLDPLVRPGMVEVLFVLLHRPVQVPFAENQDVVEALSPQAAEESLAEGVRPWRLIRSLQHFDLFGYSFERFPRRV